MITLQDMRAAVAYGKMAEKVVEEVPEESKPNSTWEKQKQEKSESGEIGTMALEPFTGLLHPSGSYSSAAAISAQASDTLDLTAGPVLAIQLPVAGTIKVTMMNDVLADAVTLTTLPAGLHKLAIRQLWANPAPQAGIIGLR